MKITIQLHLFLSELFSSKIVEMKIEEEIGNYTGLSCSSRNRARALQRPDESTHFL